MKNQLIEKIITANDLPCPEFTYENPMLNKNVAKMLSKSFVKILSLSRQNSKINNNLRLSILENIRKMCQVEPENHIKIDEHLTTLLLEFYQQSNKQAKYAESDSSVKKLDAFLIRNFKDMNINSNHVSPSNPEVLQALINLNPSDNYLDDLLRDTIHWNSIQNKTIQILKGLWTADTVHTGHTSEDIMIKLKPEIEKTILEVCFSILNESDSNIEGIFNSDTFIKKLIKKSATSANCFQICCGILNYLLIMTNFNSKIQMFVQKFVNNVKEHCTSITFAVLYPTHLSHIIVLLDIDIEELPWSLQDVYVNPTKKYLSELRLKSENDLLMLLSHYPQWFDIYFQ